MILSQSRATGWWTEFRWGRVTRWQPRAGKPLIGKLGRVHDPKQCEGRGCAIHNHPSDHPLKDAPLNWRTDASKLERICVHGVGHDDKDAVEYQQSQRYSVYNGVHGCDGCC